MVSIDHLIAGASRFGNMKRHRQHQRGVHKIQADKPQGRDQGMEGFGLIRRYKDLIFGCAYNQSLLRNS